MFKRTLALLALVAGGAATLALSAPAQAHNTLCRSATTHLVSRPDSGNHGDWALDSFTRSVTICEVPIVLNKSDVQPNTVGKSNYHAVVSDTGTFVTNGGTSLSPNVGANLRAGVKGVMSGGFTVDFVAASHFATYSNLYGVPGHNSYSGTAPVGTSAWVGSEFSDFGNQASIGDDWSWKYTADCAGQGLKGTGLENWTDANPTAGGAPTDGDITGAFLRHCYKPRPPKPSCSPSVSDSASASASASPSSSASASASASGSASASASQSTSLVLTGNSGSGGSLPVTGFPLASLVGGAVLVVGAGTTLVILARRRKQHVE